MENLLILILMNRPNMLNLYNSKENKYRPVTLSGYILSQDRVIQTEQTEDSIDWTNLQTNSGKPNKTLNKLAAETLWRNIHYDRGIFPPVKNPNYYIHSQLLTPNPNLTNIEEDNLPIHPQTIFKTCKTWHETYTPLEIPREQTLPLQTAGEAIHTLSQKNTTTQELNQIAAEHKNQIIADLIASHPNTTDETKTILALNGMRI